jgi:hypothetical protein
MAVLGQTYLNLVDVLRRTDNGKEVADIVELLSANNPILDDAIMVECNMGTFHRTTRRTGLPSVNWGALYKGIKQSKSRTQQVDDTTGFVEAYSSVDVRLLDITDNEAAVRASEGSAFMEALNQEMATGIFYHDTNTSPEKFKGLIAHGYGALATSGPGAQIVDAGGTGSDNTSLWFITWGEQYTHLIHPKGIPAGIQREDKGEQKTLDTNGDPFYTMDELWRWHMGLVVRDWRFNVRVANIDVSDIAAGTVKLYNFLRAGYYKLQNRRIVRDGNKIDGAKALSAKQIAIYCNRNVLEALDALATNAGNADNFTRLRYGELEGKEVLMYRNIPIRETDAILNTEARVV